MPKPPPPSSSADILGPYLAQGMTQAALPSAQAKLVAAMRANPDIDAAVRRRIETLTQIVERRMNGCYLSRQTLTLLRAAVAGTDRTN